MFYTYVLQKRQNDKISFYTGYTSNISERLNQHSSGGTKSTKNADELKLVYYEACLTEKDARVRELQLKTGFGRGYLKRRLENYLKLRD